MSLNPNNTVLAVAAVLASSACQRESPPQGTVHEETPQVAFQVAKSDPCGWLDRAAAERAIGAPLAADPVRVFAVDNRNPSTEGEACLYRVSGAPAGLDAIAVQVMADEPGVLRNSFAAMQRGPGLVAADHPKGAAWDLVASVPGGLLLRMSGRLAVLMSASGQDEHAAAISDAIGASIPDIPFTWRVDEPNKPPPNRDACALIGADEVSAEVGPLAVAPYRSAKKSAMVRGSGTSCTYYLRGHRALVITPTWEQGSTLFALAGDASRMTRSLGLSTRHKPAKGDWNGAAIGADGSLSVLKGDAVLNIQFLNAGVTVDQALAVADHAFERLGAGS